MALDTNALAALMGPKIKAALIAAWPMGAAPGVPPDIVERVTIAQAELYAQLGAAIAQGVAEAVVEHLRTSAVITVQVLPNGTPAMTAGGDPVLGRGTGSGTIA